MICVLAHKVKASTMPIPLERFQKIAINQHLSIPTQRQIDGHEALIVVLPEVTGKAPWPLFPYGDLLYGRYRRRRSGGGQTALSTDLPNTAGTRVTLGRASPTASAFELLTLARKLSARALEADPRTVAVCVPGLDEQAPAVAEALVAALLAAVAPMPSFKRKPDPAPALKRIELYGAGRRLDLRRTRAEAEGNALARYLTMLPPNELTPGHYRRLVAGLARQEGWRMEFWDTRTLMRRKAGAFLAVAQGSPDGDAGIVHLSYRPKTVKRDRGTLSLVGKGICFDTGGVNLKPARYMLGMHEDMAGSAVALGTLLALTRMQAGLPVECWLALAQNHIGPKAYKPNDVVTASDGTRIEVVNTDAEGRMVLADTLALAGKRKPALLVDYATLTGSCVEALSTRYSGGFCNRHDMLDTIIEAGRASGERVWPFPTDRDFDEALDSAIADVKQCTVENEADHILAARFLNRFVPAEVPWLHVDLASGNHKGGLAHIPTDTTGFGVRFTLALLGKRGML
jgi:leucyl aminopeptidase